jgi:transposase
MDEQTKGASAGIDWAKDEHALCVVEGSGRKILERRYAHDEGGIAEMCRSLAELGVERVAIERPEGILVQRLLDAGRLVVLAVHLNQLKASRPRFRASGHRSKSDSFDAFCLAELARTDSHRFRALTPDSDETEALN